MCVTSVSELIYLFTKTNIKVSNRHQGRVQLKFKLCYSIELNLIKTFFKGRKRLIG